MAPDPPAGTPALVSGDGGGRAADPATFATLDAGAPIVTAARLDEVLGGCRDAERHRLALVLSAAVALLAATVLLVGWVGGVEGVRRVLPSLESMKVNTAVGLLCFGIAGMATVRSGAAARRRVVLTVLVPLVLGVATCVEYAADLDLGLDQAVIGDPGGGRFPGRMGLNTAIAFTALGVAWLLAGPDSPRPRRRAAHVLAAVPAALALLAFAGYLVGAVGARGIGSATQMALHTAVALMAATVAMVAATGDRGPLSVMWSAGVGGRLGRSLLVPGAVSLLLSAVVAAALESAGLLGEARLDLALATTLAVVVLSGLVLVSARRLDEAGRAEQRALAAADRALADLAVANAELEARVRQRTAELEATVRDLQVANTDLEGYTHAASHELKEPLRMVSLYSGLLLDRYGEDLDERGRGYAANAVEGAHRMLMLVEGILRLADVGRTEVEMVPVPLLPIARRVAVELGGQAGRGAVVRVEEPMPTVLGDEDLLSEMLVSLVDNALTFSQPGAMHPTVVLRARAEDDEVVLEVADDGVGIPAAHRGRVVQPFARLDAVGGQPRTGMGLAICRRIAQRHGGSLEISDGPAGGTVVTIRLRGAPDTPTPGGTTDGGRG